MKLARNEDGSVTVSVPAGTYADEVYDEVEGKTYVTETLPAKEFAAAIKPFAPKPKKKPADE